MFLSHSHSKLDSNSKLELLHGIIFLYFRSAQPLVSEEEFAVTEKLVGDFMKPGGIGEKLQQHLDVRAKKKDNWVGTENFTSIELR